MKNNRIFSLLIVTIVYIVAWYAARFSLLWFASSSILVQAFYADIIATFVVFAGSMILSNSSTYDAYWSVAPVFILHFFLDAAEVKYDLSTWLIVIAVWAWAIRLTLNWARGWPNLTHEDWRYGNLAKKTGIWYPLVSLSGIHLFPTILVFAGCIPLYYASLAPLDLPLVIIGFLTCMLGTLLELVADEQLRRFTRLNRDENTVMTSGLWGYSRHPNYLGEITFWFGVFLFGLSASSEHWWTGIGFLLMVLLFRFISIPMMEKRHVEKRPAYINVQQRIPALLPFGGRKKASLIILVSIFSLDLYGQSEQLRIQVQSALANHPDLKTLSLKQEEQTLLQKEKFNSSYLPKIEGRVNYLWYWDDLPTYFFPEAEGEILSGGISTGPYPVALGLPSNLSAGISLRQNLFRYGMWNGSQISTQAEKLSNLQRQRIEEQVIYEISQAYLDYQKLLAQRQTLTVNEERLLETQRIVKVQVDAGVVAEGRHTELSLKLRELKLAKRQLENGTNILADRIRIISGESPSDLITDESSLLEIASQPAGTDVNLSLIRESEKLELEIDKLDQGSYLPSASLLADFQLQNQTISGYDAPWQSIGIIGLDLAIPIYQGGARRSASQKTSIHQSELQLQKQVLSEYGELTLNRAEEDYSIAKENLALALSYVELYQDEMKLIQLQVQQEITSSLDLIEIESKYGESLITELTRRNELHMAALNLIKAKSLLHLLR